MTVKTYSLWNLPAPFYAVHMFVLKEPDGQDAKNRYYREKLYMLDQDAGGGKLLLKTGPRIAVPTVFERLQG